MKFVFIQNNVFPYNWIELIKTFNIESSDLPNSLKPLCHILKENILNEQEQSVVSYFNRPFLRHVCLDIKWKLDSYEDIPIMLIKEVLKEMGSEKGIQFDQKLNSLFSELLAYKYLVQQGYTISNFSRSKASCDLVMEKNGEIFHCEVKVKNSNDAYPMKIMDYLNGKSYLPSYKLLRDLNMVYYRIKKYPKSYKEINELYTELEKFANNPILYDGKYITISSNKKQIPLITNDFLISNYKKNDTENQLDKILIGEGRHLSKLKEKAKKFNNFIGYIFISIPFHEEKLIDDIEDWFNDQMLPFDLYVELDGIGIEKKVLYILKK